MREIEQLDSAEVQEILNITPANLWAMLHRARIRPWHCLTLKWFEHDGKGNS